MAVVADARAGSRYGPIATLELETGLLKSKWELCDRVAEYLSGIVGQIHGDSARYANYLSVTANELVELAYNSARAGAVKFELFLDAGLVRLKINFACSADTRAAICRGVAGQGEGWTQGGSSEVVNKVSRLVKFAEVCQVQLSATEQPDGVAVTALFLWREEIA